MKTIGKVVNRIVSILLIATLLFAGYVLVRVLRSGKDRVPSVFGYSFLQVATGSMEPTIATGSLIIVHKTDAEKIQIGDVICFYSSDPLIQGLPNTHRVVQIYQENGQLLFTTMGDAAEEEDPYPVSADQLIGVYVRSLSVFHLNQILHSPYFFFFVLFVPLCIVIFVEVLHVKKAAEEKKEKADDREST